MWTSLTVIITGTIWHAEARNPLQTDGCLAQDKSRVRHNGHPGLAKVHTWLDSKLYSEIKPKYTKQHPLLSGQNRTLWMEVVLIHWFSDWANYSKYRALLKYSACVRYIFKAEWYKAVSQYNLIFRSSINWFKSWTINDGFKQDYFETQLETPNQDCESLLCKISFFSSELSAEKSAALIWCGSPLKPYTRTYRWETNSFTRGKCPCRSVQIIRTKHWIRSLDFNAKKVLLV